MLTILALVLFSGLSPILATDNRYFYYEFMFGTATSAFQVEGGWNEDGKGPSLWDWFMHNFPDKNKGYNGDVACDSYHKWKRDINMLKELGVSHYRFSISWPRILPNGFNNKVNEAGIQYYKNIIRELKLNNIEPLVTLHHWDLPQYIHELGGWQNEEIVDWFADYVKIVFNAFGDDVKYWITINEPKSICQEGYAGHLAPQYKVDGTGTYVCMHNLLKAHAKAYHLYHDELKLPGKVSIAINANAGIPISNSTSDNEVANIFMQFTLGWCANPIFNGNYPETMINRIAARSKLEGFSKSRLPEFSDDEINYIKGTADYFALNTYGPFMVSNNNKISPIGEPSFYTDMGVMTFADPAWPKAASSWLNVVPSGMRPLLNFIKHNYNDPDIMITENGYSDDSGTLNDNDRVSYIRDYLSAILEAIYDDGVRVFAYTYWSLMDNLEWDSGFTIKFGLYQVDFNDDNRSTTLKDSGKYYKNIIETKCLIDKCVEPDY